MRPQVLGQDHGAGPHVHAVLRVQHLQDTGRGAVPGSRELPLFPVSRLPPVPRAPAPPAPPNPPRTGTTARAAAAAPPWANRERPRIGARPRRPIGTSSRRDVTWSAAAGADGDAPLASRGLPRGPRLNRAAPTRAAAPTRRGGRLRGQLPGEGMKPGDTRPACHCQGSSKCGARARRGKGSGGGGCPGRPRGCAVKGARRPRCLRAARAALPQHGGAGAPLPQPRPMSAEVWRKLGRSRPMALRRGRGRSDSGGTG